MKALKAVLIGGFPQVLVESDCLDVVKVVNAGQICPAWPARKWVEEASLYFQSSQFSFTYIPRFCNLAADWVAKSAAKGLIWGSNTVAPPTPLYLICVQDLNAGSRCSVREGIG